MSSRSIRARLVGPLTALLLIIAVVANTLLYIYLRGELIEQYDDALQTQARAAAAVWQSGDAHDDADRVARALPDLHFEQAGGDFLRIVRSDGSTVLKLPPGTASELWRDAARRPTPHRHFYDLTLPDGNPGRAIEIGVQASAATSQVPPSAAPSFSLVLAEGRREMDQTLTSLAIGLFAFGGGLSATTIALATIAVRRGLRPLQSFSEAVADLNVDSLSYRFATDGMAEELLPISLRLNDLLRRVEAAFARERRFAGNVAHELRTPLAEMRSMIEVATRWPPDSGEFVRHQEGLLEIVQRMTAMTRTLLALVRSQAVVEAVASVRVSLDEMIRAAAMPHAADAANRHVGIDLPPPDGRIIHTDPAMLAPLLDNLFSNAALYAELGSRVVCTVERATDDHGYVLRLTNAVTELTAADLPNLGEPFWRKDTARSPGDHAGLGLALVRLYATALRIDVRFELSPDGRFTVILAFADVPKASAVKVQMPSSADV